MARGRKPLRARREQRCSWQDARVPRIAPGTRAELGPVNALIASGLGKAAGTAGPPNLFATLGRHRGLFRRWLFFAGGLMPGGKLPRADSELVILRVAHRTGCAYEWAHHERLGRRAGLSAQDIARVREEAGAAGWTPRQAALLRATDELLDDGRIGEDTWATLCEHLDEVRRIELCLLAGHYEMLAKTINTIGIEPDRHR